MNVQWFDYKRNRQCSPNRYVCLNNTIAIVVFFLQAIIYKTNNVTSPPVAHPVPPPSQVVLVCPTVTTASQAGPRNTWCVLQKELLPWNCVNTIMIQASSSVDKICVSIEQFI